MSKKLSPAQEQTLRAQTIGETEPGTVLRDFETLIDFIAAREIVVSGTYNVLPMSLLSELNARLSNPLDIRLKRPQQKSYPHINGLYLLVRACGLAPVETRGTRRVLALDPQALASWRGLNPTERYFTLLEAWLVHGTAEIIGERHDPLGPFYKAVTFVPDIPARGLRVAGDRQVEQFTLPYRIGLHNLALLDRFGLVRVEAGKPQEGKGWAIDRIFRTAFGDALLQLLLQSFSERAFSWEAAEAGGASAFGVLQPILQPYFPAWRNTLKLPEPEFTNGLYTFKVSLGKVWRRIAIPARFTLDDLSAWILDAFDFDHDHLYQFSFRNRFGAMVEVNHPYMEEPPSTDEVAIGSLPLRPGDAMNYLFDFGDNWQFTVQLESIDPTDTRTKKPKLLEKHGKAPEQYPNWE